MPTLKTTYYADGLFYDAMMAALRGAQSSVQIATFLIRTGYANETRANAVEAELIACAARGVDVLGVFNYSRFEPDVAAANYATAQRLAAAGCRIRLGPPNQTFHAKILIVDRRLAFVGSHNISRGALTFNREFTSATEVKELVNRAGHYFNQLWYASIPFAQAPPPTNLIPLVIELLGVAPEGADLKLTFEPNLTDGVDAFAALAAPLGNLAGAVMGETVAQEARIASVVPTVNAGAPVFVAVRGYNAGQAIATSNVIQLTYQPTGSNGGAGEGENGGGDQPPPEPLTAPTLDSVAQASLPATVTLTWQFVGSATFNRFEIQQRDLIGAWHVVGMTMESSARQWTGTPIAMSEALPFRVVVFNLAGESAASNEATLTQPPPPPPEPLTAPTLTSVVRATGDNVTAAWEFAGASDFHRFEVQRRDLALIWVTLGTVMDETVREWTGAAPNSTEDTPFRVVVFNMAEESAASNSVALATLPVLTAPTLTTLYRVGAMGLHVDWTHAGVTDFARFELQQRQTDAVTWTAFATITDPTARSWEVDFVPYRDGTHPVRVVVFDTHAQSAASNEVFIGGPDAPHIESVATASGTTVTVQWTWSGLDFQSYIVQQQDAQQTWQDLAQLFAQTPMQWTGTPIALEAGRPFRVVVNAGAPSPVAVNSNEVSLVAGPPPAPVLGVITPAPLPTVHVPWTWGGALNFARFVIQQRNGAMVWQDLATITNPASVEWTGQMLPTGQAWPFRIVVHLTTGESATSAEGYITQT